MKVKKCIVCSAENPIAAHFCKNCGNLFEGVLESGFVDVSAQKNQSGEFEKLKSEISMLTNENASLLNRYNSVKRELNLKDEELVKSKETIENNIANTLKIESQLKEAEERYKKVNSGKVNLHVCYLVAIIVLIVMSFCFYTRTASVLEMISEEKPFFINDIEVRNEGDSYGSPIISSETTFINPRIELLSLVEGSEDVLVKFYSPYGLSTGDSDKSLPKGYSYRDVIYLTKNEIQTIELIGWGNDEKGNWPAGKYSIKIYMRGVCVGKHDFIIKR